MMKYTNFNKVKLLSVRFLGDFGMYEFPGGERGCSIPPDYLTTETFSP